MNADEQENAWREGWRPNGYREPSQDEVEFSASHPGWLQAAWAHPDYGNWVRAKEVAASKRMY